jgi:outer membrane receptor protein involved in Fe transport
MFKKTVLVHALTLAFGGAALTVGLMQPAMAQSNATGTIYGQVAAPSGASVVVHNVETGLRRTVVLDAQGRYQATALPPGHYRVELTRGGNVVQSSETDVLLGQGADVSFSATPTTVVVTGRRTRIDVSNTNNGAVFTAKELAKLPVQTNLTAVALLAPNTTKADRAYGGASFGGSGASENSFYVNGFPMTNPMTQLGSVELPFGAIAQSSVITGGFGAEFGRSIGGVLNVTTKNGTNNWEVGAMTSITPNQLRAREANYYYGNTGDPANVDTDGKLHYRHDNSYYNVEQNGFYVGGPLIKDKLFMFVAGDETTTRRGFLSDSQTGNTGGVDSTTLARDGWSQRRQLQQRYVAKFDWNITDNHRLEWTSVGDNNHEKRQTYGYVLNANNPNALAQLDGTPNNVIWSELDTKNPGANGADVNMLKYTGNLTDDLTVTSLYGEMKGNFGVTYTGFGANPPPTISLPPISRRVPELDAQNLYVNHNKFPGNVGIPGSSDVKALRLDVEYKLGSHTLRAGLDHVKIAIANAGVARSGGATWIYQKVADPTASTRLGSGQSGIVGDFGGFGTRGFYATKSLFSSITNASEVQSAQYLEDRWQVSKTLLLTAGLRNDSYSNTNGDGEKFIDKKTQLAPRLSASWDVNGDASLKVYGSAGRYFLQLPTQVAARAASRSTLTRQDFTYTGIDPATGVPTGLTPINQPFSVDGEYGQKKNPQSVVVKDLKSNYQDEVTLGFEKAYSPELNFGVKGTYRKLGAGIDDNCDTRRLYQYALDHGIPVVGPQYMSCYIFNPGEDATVWIDGHDAAGNPIVSGKGQYAHFTAAELGNPKAERKYAALDFFVEHPFRNGWYAKVMYTLSRSKGNMEGQTRSDTGQTDIATTAAWDYPEFAPNSYGILPNDRLHALKAYGFYELTQEWSMGFNALIQSGRPKVCLGTDIDAENGLKDPYGATYGGPGYGAEYFWCGGKPAPRGSLGRLPTEKRLDLSLAYNPSFLKDLTLKVDVFNVFNAKTVLARQETYDDGSGEGVEPDYGEARDISAPRTVKFTAQFNHKF